MNEEKTTNNTVYVKAQTKKKPVWPVIAIIFAVVMVALLAVVLLLKGVNYFDSLSESGAAAASQAASRSSFGESLKQKAAEALVDRGIEQTLREQGLDPDDPAVKEALDRIPEEDKAAVTQIVADHLDAETVTQVAGGLAGGDTEGTLENVVENLTDEEKKTLEDLAEKYGYSLP